MKPQKHISICINTFKRPILVEKLLLALSSQQTRGLFTYNAVVVDNDSAASAKASVESVAARSSFEIVYDVESFQNIAAARNRAVGNARGDLIAFIDDDEFPEGDWLLRLFETMEQTGADGVFGPVRPHFEEEPPRWLITGGFCERPEHPTGTVLSASYCRTGNAMVSASIFNKIDDALFDPAFGRTGGEDGQFFLKQIKSGRKFVWCNEAVAYETVPPERWTRAFYIKKQARIGGVTGEMIRKRISLETLFKTIISMWTHVAAAVLYSLLLPLAVFLGQAVLLRLFLKVVYRGGTLLGFAGYVPYRFREE